MRIAYPEFISGYIPSQPSQKEGVSPLEGRLRGVNFFNRLIWAEPNGKLKHYDKRHLFRMANEHEYFSAGKERLIVEYKGWRICPLICYDLRFPVWSRNNIPNPSLREGILSTSRGVGGGSAYDCLIYIANWPEPRKKHWSKLLEARAIENQCYVIGVNRIGEDENDFTFTGNSVVNNFMGEAIATTQERVESIQTVVLSKTELEVWCEKFPVSLDGDEFEIK